MFERISEHVYIKPKEDYSDRPNIGYVKGARLSLLFECGASNNHVDEIKKVEKRCWQNVASAEKVQDLALLCIYKFSRL